MASLENVEKLRERANVSYEEAKEALEASGDDLLDAMIYLEGKGKVPTPVDGGKYSSSSSAPPHQDTAAEQARPRGESFGDMVRRFFRFCGRMIDKGNRNMFEVHRNGELVFTLPLTVLVLLFIIFFPLMLTLAVIGIFFGFRYRFSGRDLEGTGVNKIMDSAANAAESFKEEIRSPKDEPREGDGQQ